MKLATSLLTLLVAAQCYGHGNPIHLNVAAGKLTVSGGLPDDRGFAGWVFADADEEAVFAPAPGSRLATTLPGFFVEDMAPGQELWIEALSRPDFTKPAAPERWLWYWDATTETVVDVPHNPKLDVASSRGFLPTPSLYQSATPAVTSVKVANLLATDLGEHRHMLTYLLDNQLGAPLGTYAFFARLTSPDYEPSDPFLVALNHGLDAATFQQGAKHINAAARLPGDYDGDEDVDGADFLVWQRTLGSTSVLAADGSVNDVVDAADLAVWEEGFGNRLELPSSVQAVPEPGGVALALAAAGLLGACHWRVASGKGE